MYGVGVVIPCILCDHLFPIFVSDCRATLFCPTLWQCCMQFLTTLTRWIAGTAPEVLFLVCRRCKHGMFFNTCLAIGFRAFIIGGAFEMRGMVRMGVSSITNCCCSLTLCSCS